MRNLSANKANPNKPLELFVQGEGVVVEWPRNIILSSFLCTWFAFQKPWTSWEASENCNHADLWQFLMLLGHSTTTPSPWIKSCKGLLGFALFADKFLTSVATFDVHPWNQFYTLNSIFPCYFLATLKPGRAEQRNPRTYWNTGKLKQNYTIITSNNRRLRIVSDNDQTLKRFCLNAVVCFL